MNQNGTHINSLFQPLRFRRGVAFGAMIIAALIAFEIFNYSTTDFALSDLLGDLKFMGIRWATILAIAFCGIDFAGIARLFTPESGEQGASGHNEVWYLFGAWLLAATMNAMLTWWGVSLAVLNQNTLGNAVVSRETLLRTVPIFVALLVWLIRVLIIGTFSVSGDRLFSQDDQRMKARPRPHPKMPTRPVPVRPPGSRSQVPRTAKASQRTHPPAPQPSGQTETAYSSRPEPAYHTLSMSAHGGSSSSNQSSLTRPGTHSRR